MCRSNNQGSSSEGMRLAVTAAARPGGGRSACVCYSGLLRGFSDGAVAENHIAFMLEPMRRELLFREIDMLFGLSGAENIPAPILERYAAAATSRTKSPWPLRHQPRSPAVAKAKGGPQWRRVPLRSYDPRARGPARSSLTLPSTLLRRPPAPLAASSLRPPATVSAEPLADLDLFEQGPPPRRLLLLLFLLLLLLLRSCRGCTALRQARKPQA